jgi:integrase
MEGWHMARTVRDANLSSRTKRAELKPQDQPYYRSISPSVSLGYRRHKGGYGVWLVREWHPERKKYTFTPLGPADDTAEPDGLTVFSFAQAQRRAQEKRTEAAKPTTYTLRACVEEYLNYLESEKKTAQDARGRAELSILSAVSSKWTGKLGDLPCADLTSDVITTWRDTLAKSAVQRGGKPVPITDPRKRRASANRVLTTFKAALNRAWQADPPKIASDAAWRRVKPFGEVDLAKIEYLTIEQCRRLINACDEDFRLLVRAALMTGARYGELARLRCGDFNSDTSTLLIRYSKTKTRHAAVNDEGVALFTQLTAGRPAAGLMLHKPDGTPWKATDQVRRMAAACRRAGIVPGVSFHILRHSYASAMVTDGAPLIVVARSLGHSDVKMAVKHYAHLAEDYLSAAVRQHAPKFGIVDKGKVTPIR